MTFGVNVSMLFLAGKQESKFEYVARYHMQIFIISSRIRILAFFPPDS